MFWLIGSREYRACSASNLSCTLKLVSQPLLSRTNITADEQHLSDDNHNIAEATSPTSIRQADLALMLFTIELTDANPMCHCGLALRIVTGSIDLV